jgi:serine/threonine-protein kinase HipA
MKDDALKSVSKDPLETFVEIKLQVYLGSTITGLGQWQDACTLSFDNPADGRIGIAQLEYDANYIAQYSNNPAALISLCFPLDFFPHNSDRWPAFLQDIMPMGSARRFWLQKKNLSPALEYAHDFIMLSECSLSPIGNIRVAGIELETDIVKGFELKDVITRDSDFIDYASFAGAAIGGATGAGGEAPKFLLSEDDEGLFYPEASLPDEKIKQSYLVKFPRNNAGRFDHLVLEGEACYYKIASALGFNTISLAELKYFSKNEAEHVDKASLWLPRFDRYSQPDNKRVDDQPLESRYCIERYGVESLYSLHGVTQAGATIPHTEYLTSLIQYWCDHGQEADVREMVIEYLERDLLNVVLGNVDNHGRNTSVLKKYGKLSLAPIYDLAPMVLDPEGVIRTSRWSKQNELGGEFNWRGICEEIADTNKGISSIEITAELLWQELQQCAQGLREIPRLAEELGLADEISQHPKINLAKLDEKLTRWELI